MPNIVFISHAANDPDWPEAAVVALASDIQAAGAEVLLDYWHQQTKPMKVALADWRVWMRSCLNQATHVLILASPAYVSRAEPKGVNDLNGKGVALEARILDRKLYEAKQHNGGRVSLCFPVKPGVADPATQAAFQAASVPEFLKDMCSEYSLPAERDFLVSAMASPPEAEGITPINAPTEPPIPLNESRDQHLANWLASPACAPFRKELHASCLSNASRSGPWRDPHRQPEDFSAQFINHLATCQGQAIFGGMDLVLDALAAVQKHGGSELRAAVQQKQLEFYRLLMRGVVEPAKAKLAHGPGLSLAPSDDVDLCAVLAGELFGGELVYDYQPHLATWLPRWVFAVDAPANGEKTSEALERAIFTRVMQAKNGRSLLARVQAAAVSEPLSDQELSDLKTRLRRYARHFNVAMAVIDIRSLRGTPMNEASQNASVLRERLGVNVLLPVPDSHDRVQLAVDKKKLISELHVLFDFFNPELGATTHPEH